MRLRTILLVLAAIVALPAFAIDAEQAFEDPQMNQRYRALIREVRCLVCQNESIADSNAPLAADLRREIRNMMEEGATDRQISEFLVARYGNFVLFRPPVQPNTWLLWAAPFLLLIIGGAVFVRVLRTRGTQSLDDEPFEGEPDDESDDDRIKAGGR
jgi:cytochrome c-type biogenesis protein CcmH